MALIIQLLGLVVVFSMIYFLFDRERKKNRYSPFTEPSLRSPGYSLGLQVDDLSADLMAILSVIIFFPLIAYFMLRDADGILVVAIGMGLIFLLAVKKLFSLFKKLRNFSLGLDGEVYTGQELNYLMREGAWVYHDIPYKYGNIDHVIVSQGGVFAVETKAYRKPQSKKGGRDANVTIKNDRLIFPHLSTDEPIQQAKRHAKYLKKRIKDKLQVDVPVFPVIALPGWYVDLNKDDGKRGYLVCNPKRGLFLKPFVQQRRIDSDLQKKVSTHIEEFARSVLSAAEKTDPDANKKFDFLFNRKPEN